MMSEPKGFELVEIEKPNGEIVEGLQPIQVKIIHIEGRRWFDRINGNTYHSCEVFVNGESVGISPMDYGYDSAYIQSGYDLLVEKEYLPDTKSPTNGSSTPLWRVCEDEGIELITRVTDGRKRDLHTTEGNV